MKIITPVKNAANGRLLKGKKARQTQCPRGINASRFLLIILG
jgi:hypothetical protein